MIISKKTKKKIETLEEENKNLRIAIESAKDRYSELRDKMECLEKNASEEAVAQHIRNAIVRKCEKIVNNATFYAETDAFDVWVLVVAYKSFFYPAEKGVTRNE